VNIPGTDKDINKQKTALTTNNYNPFHFQQKEFGELWSTNNKVYAANVYPPKNEHCTWSLGIAIAFIRGRC